MIYLNYKLLKIKKDIYAILVPDRYNLCMLFCRAQEFYESPNLKFRNKSFSIWEYYNWYSQNGDGCFSYVRDFCGFNLPLKTARKCYSLNKVETPYDKIFKNIISKIKSKDGYLIGCDKINSSTFNHELCHALYYTNKQYKKEMDKVTKFISKDNINAFNKNLISKGYCLKVAKDEIQAYMATEINKQMTKGMNNLKNINKQYKKIFDSFRLSQ